MDGRNCTGRRISLLNDSSNAAAQIFTKHQLPSFAAHSHSHSRASSSCASTPSLTPQTPQLSRTNSSDSRNLASPSPITPTLNNIFDAGHRAELQRAQEQQQYFIPNQSQTKMDDQNAPMYPPIPDATGVMSSVYPLPPQQMPIQPTLQAYRSSNSPQSEPSHLSNVSGTSTAKLQPKKNQYPCPMAKQIGCTDFFTTSGHAARHAKKHTGKKDAFCPDCNKAFTRKDNMEQHRRTHQNGRGAPRPNATGDDSKVKKATKTAKKSGVKAEPHQLEAAVEQQLAEQAQPVQVPLVAQIAQVAQQQAAQVQAAQQQQALEQALLMPVGGPYFLNTTDPGPIPALPNVMPDLTMRPPLHRANFTTNLDYVPPMAVMSNDPESLHYSYPSPGLSNGLNSLALASEHRRLSEEKGRSQSPLSQQETPSEQS